MNAFLDVISPGQALVRQAPKILPIVLVVVVIVVVVAAVVIRRKKK